MISQKTHDQADRMATELNLMPMNDNLSDVVAAIGDTVQGLIMDIASKNMGLPPDPPERTPAPAVPTPSSNPGAEFRGDHPWAMAQDAGARPASALDLNHAVLWAQADDGLPLDARLSNHANRQLTAASTMSPVGPDAEARAALVYGVNLMREAGGFLAQPAGVHPLAMGLGNMEVPAAEPVRLRETMTGGGPGQLTLTQRIRVRISANRAVTAKLRGSERENHARAALDRSSELLGEVHILLENTKAPTAQVALEALRDVMQALGDMDVSLPSDLSSIAKARVRQQYQEATARAARCLHNSGAGG